jgi:hypothetical protein
MVTVAAKEVTRFRGVIEVVLLAVAVAERQLEKVIAM